MGGRGGSAQLGTLRGCTSVWCVYFTTHKPQNCYSIHTDMHVYTIHKILHNGKLKNKFKQGFSSKNYGSNYTIIKHFNRGISKLWSETNQIVRKGGQKFSDRLDYPPPPQI